MSIDPKTLTAEERAIVEEMVTREPMFIAPTEQHNGHTMTEKEWAKSYEVALTRILARRALFAPAQPEPKPWKCKRCGESLADGEDHLRPLYHPGHFAYTCQRPEPKREPAATVDKGRGLYNKFIVDRADGKSEPGEKHYGCEYFVLDLTHDKFAQPALLAYAKACSGEFPQLADDLFKKCGPPAPSPAPVAGELAEAVRNAAALLRSFGNSKPLMQTAANALEAWARSQAQQHRFEIKTLEAKYDNERVLRERDARSQAQPVARDLPKARGYFDSLANLPQYQNAEGMEFIAEIRAELDAQPKAVPVDLTAQRRGEGGWE